MYLNLYKSISSINIKYNIFKDLNNYGKAAVFDLFSNLKRYRKLNMKPSNSFFFMPLTPEMFLKELQFCLFHFKPEPNG